MGETQQAFPKAKMMIQQCSTARLQVTPAAVPKEEHFVQIDRGIVVFVCFLKGASLETVHRMARVAMNVRLSGNYEKRVSVLDLPGDVLIAPQSTMAGRLKGRRADYSELINKDEARKLYEAFVLKCTEILKDSDNGSNRLVRAGAYASKQETFTLQSDGPFVHTFEF